MDKANWKFSEAWFIRRGVYAALAVVLLLLVGFGVISSDTMDQLLEKADMLLGLLIASGALGFASSKTNAGSDSTVTAQDVAAAAESASAGASDYTIRATVAEVLDQVNSYGKHAEKLGNSFGDYLKEARGE